MDQSFFSPSVAFHTHFPSPIRKFLLSLVMLPSLLNLQPDKTYLLRLVNATINDDLLFSIANHIFTTVYVYAIYVKPFESDTIIISPRQITNVLLKTRPHYPCATFHDNFGNSTVVGILEYHQPKL
uniref:Plastocyanin-like domain-containing protein n=1 Tax=Chenopodium quinoa TaxID=63459 RepID=A0A803N578_CHEQI